eukprot:scpid39768/ scgid8607/ 
MPACMHVCFCFCFIRYHGTHSKLYHPRHPRLPCQAGWLACYPVGVYGTTTGTLALAAEFHPHSTSLRPSHELFCVEECSIHRERISLSCHPIGLLLLCLILTSLTLDLCGRGLVSSASHTCLLF